LLAFVEPLDSESAGEYSIPYEDLEVRHLGELHETILEYTVQLADADRIRRRTKKGIEILLASQTQKRAGDTFIKKGDVYFGESALERKQTGSYYTPESLVRFLNEKTIIQPLREIFEEKYRQRFNDFLEQAINGHDIGTRRGAAQSAAMLVVRFAEDELLKFKVCDLAMGSGHFLVDAANQMAGLVVSLFAEIETEPMVNDECGMMNKESIHPSSFIIHHSINAWRRRITRHCIYGVDLNPLAVNLAKLSLWLNCFASDHKLTFLDHHVRCGNSLIGIRSLQQLATIPGRKKDGKKKDNSAGKLFPNFQEYAELLTEAGQDVQSISAMDEDETGEQKSVFEQAQQKVSALKPLADLYTSYLMDGSIQPDDYHELFYSLARKQNVHNPLNPDLPKILEKVETRHYRHRFFHWPFEFPDIFRLDTAGGFSATVGNPPWDIVKPNSQEFFSDYDPGFRSYDKQKANRESANLMADNPIIAEKWEQYCDGFIEQSAYFKEPVSYCALGKGDINTFKLFLEQFFTVIGDDGRMGIVVPSGIYTDQGCQPLRELFFSRSRIDFLYCFENRWPTVFSAVDGRFKFVTFGTQKGGSTDRFKCTFMEHDPERLQAIDADALKMSMKQVKKFSPDTMSIMEFNNQCDIDICAQIYDKRIPLGELLRHNWNVSFQREFHIRDDSSLFVSIECLEQVNLLPLWEGKQIWILSDGWTKPTNFLAVEDTTKKPTTRSVRLAYRALAANTNERTFIPTIIPENHPTGNSLNVCPLPTNLAILLSGILSTFVLDWVIRKKITTNVNIFYVEQFPVPILNKDSYLVDHNWIAFIIACACRLLCTSELFSSLWMNCFSMEWQSSDFWYPSTAPVDTYGPVHEQEIRRRLRDEARNLTPEWGPRCGVHDRLPDRRDTGDRAQLRAETDAYVAHIYGLSRDDFAYILDTFPVLRKKENKAFGEFMSKRKRLEEYDRIKIIMNAEL